MNSDCETMKDLIADLVTGILSEDREQKLRQHLAQCAACRDYAHALQHEDALLTEYVEKMDTDMTQRRERLLQAIDRSCQSELIETPSIRRIIMKSPIIKYTAAAVIIIAVFVGIDYFGAPMDGASVTWGKVLNNVESAKTITWKSTSTEKGNSTIFRYMVLEPHLMRTEWSNGKVKISDHREEKALLLNPANMTGTVLYARQKTLDIYNSFVHFKDRPLSVTQINSRDINGKRAIGLNVEASYQKLPGGNRHYGVMDNGESIIELERIVWIDPESLLPVLIEETFIGAKGRTVNVSTDDIQFDVELNESLFSLVLPNGYTLKHDAEQYDRMKSASDMDQILKACMIYDNKHGEWPESLEALRLPGIDVTRYIYVRPDSAQKRSRIPKLVLYDAFEVWKNGINAGFTDYRVEFIENESDLQEFLQLK